MPFCLCCGSIKVMEKIILIFVTTYLCNSFSSLVPFSCPMTMAKWKIFPFDKNLFPSSVLFMSGAAITIVEYNVWPYCTKPKNTLLRTLGELYIMTTIIMIVYIIFWHPIVIFISMATNALSVLTAEWVDSTYVYKKSIPICMGNIRSTKFYCILLSFLLLHNILTRLGRQDLKRIRHFLSEELNVCTNANSAVSLHENRQ